MPHPLPNRKKSPGAGTLTTEGAKTVGGAGYGIVGGTITTGAGIG